MTPLLDLPQAEWSNALGAGGNEARRPHPDLAALLVTLGAQIRLQEGVRARLSRPIKGPRRIPFPGRQPFDRDVRALVTLDGHAGISRRLEELTLRDLVLCHPTRDYSRRPRQLNKPVAFYSRTVGDFVMCESQHERRFAQLADWTPQVAHLAAQPFTLEFPPGADLTFHTPDFAIVDWAGQVLAVDVKREEEAFDEDTVVRHQRVKALLARSGIRHVVWSGVPEVVTDNIADFAAARVPSRLLAEALPVFMDSFVPGVSRDDLLRACAEAGLPRQVGRVVFRRLLWDRTFAIDLARRLDGTSEVFAR